MLDTAIARFRCGVSLVFGWPFPSWALDCSIASAREARPEAGVLPATNTRRVGAPILDEDTRQTMQLRRFRTQAMRGTRETTYYAALFERLGLQPDRVPRARSLFGTVEFVQSYAMTETWPCVGTRCAEGHLHFEPSQGLVEVLDLETGAPAQPGEAGMLVVTPFAPYRDATVILRYRTEDIVRPLTEPPHCDLRHMPATSDILGKMRLAVQYERGGIFPRGVLEALEAVETGPLPARYGFWAVPGGVAVEVVAPDTQSTRRCIEVQLEAQGVPVRQLHLVPNPTSLQQPRPLRCDLREQIFTPRTPTGTGT